jgi:hypothetical protein
MIGASAIVLDFQLFTMSKELLLIEYLILLGRKYKPVSKIILVYK